MMPYKAEFVEWVQEASQKKQPNTKRVKPALWVWYVVKNPLLILASLYILYRYLLKDVTWMDAVCDPRTLDHLPFFVVVVLWVVVERTTTSILIYVRYKLRDDGGWGPSVFVVVVVIIIFSSIYKFSDSNWKYILWLVAHFILILLILFQGMWIPKIYPTSQLSGTSTP